jgi:hypothetical protein
MKIFDSLPDGNDINIFRINDEENDKFKGKFYIYEAP